jgi:hypothetical protein
MAGSRARYAEPGGEAVGDVSELEPLSDNEVGAMEHDSAIMAKVMGHIADQHGEGWKHSILVRQDLFESNKYSALCVGCDAEIATFDVKDTLYATSAREAFNPPEEPS